MYPTAGIICVQDENMLGKAQLPASSEPRETIYAVVRLFNIVWWWIIWLRPSVRKGREKYARFRDCLEDFLSEGFAFGTDLV